MKVTKTLLAKVVGSCILIVEEIYTVLADIEATLNSRPLIPLEASLIDGVSVLTSGHFLIGRPLRVLPEKVTWNSSLTSLRSWNLCQRLSMEVWDRWSQEYIHLLQRHAKWKDPSRNVKMAKTSK